VVRRPTEVNFKLFSAGSIGSVKVLNPDLLVLLHQGKRTNKISIYKATAAAGFYPKTGNSMLRNL